MPVPNNLENKSKNALLQLDDLELRNLVIQHLNALSYKVRTARLASEVQQLLKAERFEVVVLYDRSAGSAEPLSKVWADALNALTPDERRDLFVVLIGPNLQSATELQAFAFGADLTVNVAEMPQLSEFLFEGFQRRDEFYKIYYEAELIARLN